MISSSNNLSKITVLDCTLRDGGYYNNWNFDPNIVMRYFRSVENAGVDAVELGFRLPPQKKFIGAFGYSTEKFLSGLSLPSCKLGIMINAKGATPQWIQNSFVSMEDSVLDFVRVAVHFSHIKEAKSTVEILKNMGYFVCLNLMQISLQSEDEISCAVREVNSWNLVDILYFADSFGNLGSSEVSEIVANFELNWNGEIGIHAHNNKNQALSNTLVAMNLGVNWLDGTVLGMGRGAGNVHLEELIIELENLGFPYNSKSLLPLVLEDFQKLHFQYNWGNNILYYMSAIYGVHPTYVQNMLEDTDCGASQLLSAMQTLRDNEPGSFNSDKLAQALLGEESVEGSWSASNWVKDREVLILASGPSVQQHKQGLLQFIRSKNPFVISLNCADNISDDIIDTYAVCHYSRILSELNKYDNFKTPMLVPFESLPTSLQSKMSSHTIYDYGVKVETGEFVASESSCVIPILLVAPYVFAAVNAGQASMIYLAGFDGFDRGNSKQSEMLMVFDCYRKCFHVPMVSLTPTNYPVNQSSVYSPEYYE